MRIRILTAAVLVLGLATSISAATKGKIYLDPDDQFSAYFSAALQKKKVPVTITTDPNQADYTQFQAKDNNGPFLKDVLSTLSGANSTTIHLSTQTAFPTQGKARPTWTGFF